MNRIILIAALMTGCAAQEPNDNDVTIQVDPDDAACSETGKPVAVVVTNGSTKPLLMYGYGVQVKQRGHSQLVLQENFESDKIIKPKEEDGFCLPKLAGYDSSRQTPEYAQDVEARLSGVADSDLEYTGVTFDVVFGD